MTNLKLDLTFEMREPRLSFTQRFADRTTRWSKPFQALEARGAGTAFDLAAGYEGVYGTSDVPTVPPSLFGAEVERRESLVACSSWQP